MAFSKRFLICIINFIFYASTANADISLIRDTQTEEFIRKISSPIFYAANLDPTSIKIYIINDNNINAFVSSGQNLFMNSGLLTASSDVNGVIGVIAHETGHIAGGHIARISSDGKDMQRNYVLGFILGIGAALAGSADAAQAIILGNMQIAERSLLSYTRSHEEAADQAAIKYLHDLDVSAKGLLDFFKILEEKEKINISNNNPYLRTHPLTENRIEHMAANVAKEDKTAMKENYISKEIEEEFLFIKTKLEAFLDPKPEEKLKKLQTKLQLNFREKYQKAILLHRLGKSNLAVEIIDELIRERPGDYYLDESKGQLLFESGEIDQAIITYEEILNKIDSPLIKIQYASAINSANEKVFYNLAIKQLNYVIISEEGNVVAWDLLSELYAKNGYIAMSNLAKGESFYLQGQYDLAISKAKQAIADFEKDLTRNLSKNQQIQKAKDLLYFAKQAKKEEK